MTARKTNTTTAELTEAEALAAFNDAVTGGDGAAILSAFITYRKAVVRVSAQRNEKITREIDAHNESTAHVRDLTARANDLAQRWDFSHATNVPTGVLSGHTATRAQQDAIRDEWRKVAAELRDAILDERPDALSWEDLPNPDGDPRRLPVHGAFAEKRPLVSATGHRSGGEFARLFEAALTRHAELAWSAAARAEV